VPFWYQPSHVHHISSITQNPLFITHIPSPSCILVSPMPSYNSTIKYRSTIKGQKEHEAKTHSHPTPRSGWGASPRRETLAQTSSLRLGENSRIWNSGLCTFSLRRDSPRLSEMLACSKLSGPPGRPFAWEGLGDLYSPRLGETSSLGRVYQSQPLSVPATVVFFTYQRHINHFMHSQQHTSSRIIKIQQNNSQSH